MSTIEYCPGCGTYRSYPQENTCRSCSFNFSNHEMVEGNKVQFENAYAGATVQAEMYASVMNGLMGMHGVTLLQQFWDRLGEPHRKHLAKAVVDRFEYLVANGSFDKNIVAFLDSGDGIVARSGIIEPAEYDDDMRLTKAEVVPESIRRAMVVRAATIVKNTAKSSGYKEYHDFQQSLTNAIGDGARSAAEAIVGRILESSEVLEGIVRDRMPDLEELAEKTIRQLTSDAIDEVKRRVQKGGE